MCGLSTARRAGTIDRNVREQLEAPFSSEGIEFFPMGKVFQNCNGETNIAVAAYVDKSHYRAQHQAVLGVDGWSIEYRELSPVVIVALMTTHFPSRMVVREGVDAGFFTPCPRP